MTDIETDRTPANDQEDKRLQALDRCSIMNTGPEHAFDRCVFAAAQVCRTPAAFVSLVDGSRRWLKSAVGPIRREVPRDDTLCWSVVTGRTEMLVEDISAHARFSGLPSVAGPPPLRFYFGVPLKGPDGHVVGALCVIDTKPRTMSERQMRAMRDLAREVGELIRMRVPGLDLEQFPP